MNINLLCYNLIVCSLISKLTYSLVNFTVLDNYVEGYEELVFICFDLWMLNMLEKYK